LILGARYVDFNETFRVFTGDDDLTFPDVNGVPDPRRQAFQTAHSHNRLVAPQVGLEYGFPIPCCWLEWLSCGGTTKLAPGVNFVETTHSLVRGDGFIGYSTTHNDITFSAVADFSLWFDIHFTERFRCRAAYNAMWMLQFSVAQDIYDTNLA